jgi:hypothetical protein
MVGLAAFPPLIRERSGLGVIADVVCLQRVRPEPNHGQPLGAECIAPFLPYE